MQRFILFTLTLLIGLPQASFAVRVLEQIEKSYELSLSDVDLPSSAAGAVVVKTCPTCNAQSLATTTSTRYYVDKQQVTLAELREQAATFSRSPNVAMSTLVMVHYDIDTNVVTRIRISTPSVQ